MFEIFLGLTPFIFIILLGFLFGRFKVFDLSHAKILNLFLYYVAVPALIIKFVAQSEIGQIDLKQNISYFLMQSICGILTFIITSKYFKRPIPESIIWTLTVTLSNHVTLLLPITQIYFSEEVVTQVTSIILMDGVILLSLIAFFLELSTKRNVQLIIFIKNIFLNPMILSILIGVFLIVYNFKIDDSYIEYTLSTLALCVSPVGLFAIGIILSFHCDNVINKLTISISFLKLVISPLILLLIGYTIFDVSVANKISGAFFVSVAPCGVTSVVLCSAYNVNPQNIIKAIFISTFLSIGTIFFAIKYLTV
tara:strand:+ start:515 stop:1441 length:927 start_codon:yes stop_codon:yes gene_type:complete